MRVDPYFIKLQPLVICLYMVKGKLAWIMLLVLTSTLCFQLCKSWTQIIAM